MTRSTSIRQSFLAPEDGEIARLTLGQMLKKLRKSRNLTGAQLGALVNLSQASIARIESGDSEISKTRLTSIMNRLDAGPDERQVLSNQFDLMFTSPLSYRHIEAHGLDRKQKEILAYEALAERIDAYEPTVMPGLLQTPQYTRELLEILRVPPGPAEAATQARQQRRRILAQPARSFHFIVAEAVLYSVPKHPLVQIEQLNWIRMQIPLRHIRVGIVPTTRGNSLEAVTSFVIYNRSFATAETVISEQQVRNSADVETFIRVHQDLAARSVYGPDAVELIDRAVFVLEDQISGQR